MSPAVSPHPTVSRRRTAARVACTAAWSAAWAAAAIALSPAAFGAPSLPAGPAVSDAPAVAAPASDADTVAQWIRKTADNGGKPYAIVDKRQARVRVYAADGRLLGQSPVLLGAERGDDSVPGIGERPMAQIQPHERTTPAGRFVSEPGVNTQGEDIVWVDYDAAISMHRVRTGNARDRRLQRLATPTVQDNRISYGCINVPAAFYDRTVRPALGHAGGVVYVLPETRSAAATFGIGAEGARARIAAR